MAEGDILILSDDAEARQMYLYAFAHRGMTARVGDFTLGLVENHLADPPDLILIDSYAARSEALAVCRRLRLQIANPILLLTYGRSEPDVLQVYEAGADECILKPIGGRLLQAKVRAWLRHSWTVPTAALNVVEAAGIRLDPDQRRLRTLAGSEVKLTNLEFRLLHLLMTHQGQSFNNKQIIERVWGYASDEDTTLIKNLVYRVRRKVEADPSHPRHIQTVSGEGYCFSRS